MASIRKSDICVVRHTGIRHVSTGSSSPQELTWQVIRMAWSRHQGSDVTRAAGGGGHVTCKVQCRLYIRAAITMQAHHAGCWRSWEAGEPRAIRVKFKVSWNCIKISTLVVPMILNTMNRVSKLSEHFINTKNVLKVWVFSYKIP